MRSAENPNALKLAWNPLYSKTAGGKHVDYSVKVDLGECPVSFIEDGTPELVNILDRMKRMRDTYGAPISDKPLNKWPGKLVEALEVLEQCRIAEHDARVTAEIRESGKK